MKFINPNIDILNRYINSDTKVHCKCKVDGYEWDAIPYDIKNGSGCPKCAKCIKKTTKQFATELSNITNYVSVIGEYTGNKNKILCRCNLCGKPFESLPINLLRGHIHKECAIKIRNKRMQKSNDDFVSDIANILPDIKVIGIYNGRQSRIKVKCTKCGHIWTPLASNLLHGYGCPICVSSKGEKHIRNFLDIHNIDYKEQYRINECRNKKPLPFDFAIFHNNKLFCLIEYDGAQHFQEWHSVKDSKEELNEIKHRDSIKTKYCKCNNIKLLRIPYWKFNHIEDILEDEIVS